jgi:acetyl esterase/lipase
MQVTREMTDPELWTRGSLFRRFMGSKNADGLRKQNRQFTRLAPLIRRRLPKNVQIATEWVARPDGTRLRLLVATPLEPQPNVAGILWIHGGGYAVGSPDMEAPIFSQLVGLSDCVMVSPDYRLSPEAPYPAALDDCYLALVWLRDNAARLGVRADQLAVAGGSAGGGLTAAVTLYARDKAEIAIAFQMPIYPMIDDRSSTESARENDAPVWDAETNRSGWKLYLGELYGTDDVPIYAAPARATDLRGLPPTFTFVGDLEPFRDETIAYVEGLRAAGVPVEFHLHPGCWHGFDGLAPKAQVSMRAVAQRNRWFRHAIETYFAPQPD